MGSNRFRQDMPRYVDLYLDGRLKLDELVSARIKLEEVNDGFARSGQRRGGAIGHRLRLRGRSSSTEAVLGDAAMSYRFTPPRKGCAAR